MIDDFLMFLFEKQKLTGRNGAVDEANLPRHGLMEFQLGNLDGRFWRRFTQFLKGWFEQSRARVFQVNLAQAKVANLELCNACFAEFIHLMELSDASPVKMAVQFQWLNYRYRYSPLMISRRTRRVS